MIIYAPIPLETLSPSGTETEQSGPLVSCIILSILSLAFWKVDVFFAAPKRLIVVCF